MYADDRGDMGFMESMVATVAVVVVLTAFMGVLSCSLAVYHDPVAGLDPAMMTGWIEGGEFRPGYEGYVVDYMEARGLSGISVSVTVPGGFCGDVPVFVHGSMDGELYSRTFTSLVRADDGRAVVAVLEVVACA